MFIFLFKQSIAIMDAIVYFWLVDGKRNLNITQKKDEMNVEERSVEQKRKLVYWYTHKLL